MTTYPTLLSPKDLGPLTLKNRVVMSPMTRSRAVEAHSPNALVAEYYAQRADAGLIITEGTSPSPDGLGYADAGLRGAFERDKEDLQRLRASRRKLTAFLGAGCDEYSFVRPQAA